ncbi:hypothetical protein [Lysobacter gummosus]|uniref:hypothetical protein n=1 Tax=Lysobacter gummosus TaxID=262324 RepID=UPI00362F13D9
MAAKGRRSKGNPERTVAGPTPSIHVRPIDDNGAGAASSRARSGKQEGRPDRSGRPGCPRAEARGPPGRSWEPAFENRDWGLVKARLAQDLPGLLSPSRIPNPGIHQTMPAPTVTPTSPLELLLPDSL